MKARDITTVRVPIGKLVHADMVSTIPVQYLEIERQSLRWCRAVGTDSSTTVQDSGGTLQQIQIKSNRSTVHVCKFHARDLMNSSGNSICMFCTLCDSNCDRTDLFSIISHDGTHFTCGPMALVLHLGLVWFGLVWWAADRVHARG
jgi:hypothetical protein